MEGTKMKSTRHNLPALTSVILALSLCFGQGGNPAAYAATTGGSQSRSARSPRQDKVSPDLRQSLRSKKGSDRVQVILQISGKPTAALRALLSRNGVRVKKEFGNLQMLTVELPLSVIEQLAAFAEVTYISVDRPIISLGGHLSTTTGADAVRQQMTSTGTSYTLDGTGVGIAFLDSGLYSAHKAFNGRLGGSKDYTGENVVEDPYGHGTHVAGIAAGSGSILSGKYIGIAPGATIYNLRVLNSKGVGTVSSVLAAINDLLLYASDYNIRVVNMSLGMPAVDSYRNDPVCIAVRKLTDAGVVVVAAAGNDGKDRTSG